jgi:hypothetical protein
LLSVCTRAEIAAKRRKSTNIRKILLEKFKISGNAEKKVQKVKFRKLEQMFLSGVACLAARVGICKAISARTATLLFRRVQPLQTRLVTLHRPPHAMQQADAPEFFALFQKQLDLN